MFEEARALNGMISLCSLTQSEIAKQMGVSQSYVANKLRLLNFSEYIQLLIIDAGLTERHARLLLRLKEESKIHAAIDKIKTMKLSVAASEAMIDNMLIDEMPKRLIGFSAHEGISRFEDIISESIKNLASIGIRVSKRIDYSGNKRYIMLSIEE